MEGPPKVKRRTEPTRPPEMSTRYRADMFNTYEPRLRETLAEYYNILQTVYPLSAQNSHVDSRNRPKRVIDEIQAKRFIRPFFRRLSELHDEVLGRPLPPVLEERYLQSVTKSVSVPADRDAAELPGILGIQARLREDRERVEAEEVERNRLLEQGQLRGAPLEPEQLPPPRLLAYVELENEVGVETAKKLNQWLRLQYEAHLTRVNSTEARQMILELFQPLGAEVVPDVNQVAMFGRLYTNPEMIEHVGLTSRLTYNFELTVFQGEPELQPEILEANALLLFTALYYAVIPEFLGMLLFLREETGATEGYRSPLQGFNLAPALYYIYDSADPEKFNTMIKSLRAAILPRYLARNLEIVNGPGTIEEKYDRLVLGIIRTFRIIYRQMNQTMLESANEWRQWEQYTVEDEEGNMGLPVKNVNLLMLVPYVRESGLMLNFPEYEELVVELLDAFTNFDVPLPATRKLNWEFYGGKNDDVNAYQFFEMEKVCTEKLKADLLENGYPEFEEEEVTIESLKEYGRNKSVTIKFIGAEMYNYGSKHTIVATPSHVELLPTSGSNNNANSMAAIYHPWKAFQRNTKVVARERRPSKEWKIGADLPYDEDQNIPIEKELRCRSIAVDIECLALEEERQIPYMINAVGYPGDNSRIIYRSWTNKGIYRFHGMKEEKKELWDSDWTDEYCLYAFVEWLALISKDYTKEEPLYVWGFNSMGYELTYLLLPITQKFGEIEMLGHPSACKAFKLCDRRIVFCDILKILVPKTLSKYCEEFDLKVKKMDLKIAKIDTWELVEQNQEVIREYCYIDCVSTLLLVHKTQSTLVQLCKNLNIPHDVNAIATKITASALGWFFYVQGFLKKSITNTLSSKGENVFINNEPFPIYCHQRASYTGGVVQVYKYLHIGKLYIVDVNSMYPAMMCKPLPWVYIGEQNTNLEATLNEAESDLYLYCVESYELPATFVGSLIALKKGSKNVYQNSYYGEKPIYVRGMVIKRLLKHKGTIKLLHVYKYSNGGNWSLREFAQTIYKERLNSKTKAMKELTKLMMNSVTGRCAMSPQTEYKSRNSPSSDVYIFYDEDLFIQSGESTLPPSGRLVRITAAITDYAKVYLDELHEKAGYGNVIYSDTDSHVVNQMGYDNLGRPGRESTTLGEFKVEVKEDMANHFFNEGCFKNRKDYVLEYDGADGKIKHLHKSKGIPKRYINEEYSRQIIRAFKACQPDLVRRDPGTTLVIGDKVEMQVWRRQPFGGTTIRHMLKKSTVIVDRYFDAEGSIGLPRNDKYISQMEDEEL